MTKHKRRVVGLELADVIPEVLSPSAFADKLAALGASIDVLVKAVNESTAPKLNAPWRASFQEFVRRWDAERNSYRDWGSRLFLAGASRRLSQFTDHWGYWARQFEARTGTTLPRTQPLPTEALADSVPSQVWWILAAGVVVYAYASGRK